MKLSDAIEEGMQDADPLFEIGVDNHLIAERDGQLCATAFGAACIGLYGLGEARELTAHEIVARLTALYPFLRQPSNTELYPDLVVMEFLTEMEYFGPGWDRSSIVQWLRDHDW